MIKYPGGKARDPAIIFYLSFTDKLFLLDPYCFYLQEARKRIFPPFADIDAAVEEYAKEWHKKSAHRFNPETDHEADFAEEAYERATSYGQMLDEMANNVRLVVLAGLHHRWEKDLRAWIVRELEHSYRHPDLARAIQKATLKSLAELLTALGVPVTTFHCWPQLELFGKVVNVFKHGDGPALDILKQSGPEYFWPSFSPTEWQWEYVNHHNLHITPAQFDELAATVTNFWHEIPEHVTEDDATGTLPPWFAKLQAGQ